MSEAPAPGGGDRPARSPRVRENNHYWHAREGYATAVEFAIFDEIGKMSDILGHDLL